MRQCATCLEYQQMQPQEKMILYELPYKPWEVDNTTIFVIKNKTLLRILYCYSNFPIVKKVGSLAVDDLVQMTKIIFAEYGLSKKMISDAGTNFTSKIFTQFCRQMSIQQSITSSYHPLDNGQVEACIKFVEHTIKNALILVRMSI